MLRSHKIRLNPTPEQDAYFRRAAGTSRFIFNWGLERWNEQSDRGGKPSALALKTAFNAIRRTQYPWTYEVTKTVVEGAFYDLAAAFKHYFDRLKTGKLTERREDGRLEGYPRFKSKKRSSLSFYISNDKFQVDRFWIRIPKLGWVNMTEQLRLNGKIMSATVSYKAGWWWVAIVVDILHTAPRRVSRAVGIDLGVKTLVTCSDGQVVENQHHLKRALRKIKHLQREVSRKVKGSQNQQKAIDRLAKAHFKVWCARQDTLHKLTTRLTQEYSLIGLEDLNVAGMVQNHHLAQAIGDASFSEISRQFDYKAKWYGTEIVNVGRFYPSSQVCNRCGYRYQDLGLAQRKWHCPICDVWVDRDLNAARNIRDEALRLHAASR